MSESLYVVSTHVIQASHVREYHRGARSSAAALELKLSVKKYTPRDQTPSPNAFTIIATHANGFPKETYEPLWDQVLQMLPAGTIRSIWIADCAHQNASAALNEGLIGDDPNWFDHSRDLLSLINRFAAEMPLPIIGVGHSMGCAQLLRLASIHPRLLFGLALVEPVVQHEAPPGPNNAFFSSYRPDWWPSRAKAEQVFRETKALKKWNKEAFGKLLQHGLRETPTEIYPDKGGITLATSRAQEAWSFSRGNFNEVGSEQSERKASPDLDDESRSHLFHRSEASQMARELPFVRPHVLYVFGAKSFINTPALRADKMERTGTGLNGSGGAAAGNVEQVVIEKAVHMLPMEHVEETASALVKWLEKQATVFAETEKWHQDYKRGVSENEDGLVLSKQWMEKVRQKEDTPRKMSTKL